MMRSFFIVFSVLIFLFLFTSCSNDGKSGKNSLTLTTDEAPGENCANGGIKIETGLDTNSNGMLDADEVTNTEYVCNGEDGGDKTDEDKTDNELSDKEPTDNEVNDEEGDDKDVVNDQDEVDNEIIDEADDEIADEKQDGVDDEDLVDSEIIDEEPVDEDQTDSEINDEDQPDEELPDEELLIEKQWGTSGNDSGESITVDSFGNIFVLGYTEGDLDGNTTSGSRDIFLTKYSIDGGFEWTKQWGTDSYEHAHSVAVDSSGNIFVAGETSGTFENNTRAGASDIFLTKWNSDGTSAWTKQWGTTGYDYGNSVTVDSSGNIFVAGETQESLDENSSAGGYDLFLTKWNADGTKLWTKQWGTSENDFGKSVTADSSDNIVVTGYTDGVFSGNTSAGSSDIFATKWDSGGTEIWTKQWGTTGDDSGYSVATDISGSVFVTGVTLGTFDGNTSSGVIDAFVTKYDGSGNSIWTRQLGTASLDYSNSVAVDSSGNIFVAGYTMGTFEGNTSAGSYDIFLSKYDNDGTFNWADQWGTSTYDAASSVFIDSSDVIYLTGFTSGNLSAEPAGGYDIILIKMTKN